MNTWHLGGFTASYNRRAWSLATPTGEELRPLLDALAQSVVATVGPRPVEVGATLTSIATITLPLNPFLIAADAKRLVTYWTVKPDGGVECDAQRLGGQLLQYVMVRNN